MLDITSVLVHHLADAPLARVGGFTFTKHMLMMTFAATLTVGLVMAGAYGKGWAASRIRIALEAFAEFIWSDIVRPALGDEGQRYLHFFLTLFVFIFFMNILGLVPFGATATGNISVTAALSLMTLALINGAGIKRHGLVRHFGNLVPHGVPLWIAPLVFLIELMGYFTKTIALCIRLFANMTAGHLVILLFLVMILVFGQTNAAAGLAVAPISVGLAVGLYLLELIVAVVQAYVFTMLTAVFIGGALHPEH